MPPPAVSSLGPVSGSGANISLVPSRYASTHIHPAGTLGDGLDIAVEKTSKQHGIMDDIELLMEPD